MKVLYLAILFLLHPVHVSLTGIEYSPENRTYSIFIKVYCDDLESDMKLGYRSINSKPRGDEERYLAYLSDRVRVYENKRLLEMKLISSESDGIERRFNLEARGGKSADSIVVVNRIMTGLYQDQANMLLFRYKETEEGFRFTVTDTLRSYYVK